jgi:hypothetical protein
MLPVVCIRIPPLRAVIGTLYSYNGFCYWYFGVPMEEFNSIKAISVWPIANYNLSILIVKLKE